LLITAIVSGAIISVAQFAIAERIREHRAFVLPAIC